MVPDPLCWENIALRLDGERAASTVLPISSPSCTGYSLKVMTELVRPDPVLSLNGIGANMRTQFRVNLGWGCTTGACTAPYTNPFTGHACFMLGEVCYGVFGRLCDSGGAKIYVAIGDMAANATAVVRVCDQLVAELCGDAVKVRAHCWLLKKLNEHVILFETLMSRAQLVHVCSGCVPCPCFQRTADTRGSCASQRAAKRCCTQRPPRAAAT